MAEAALELFDDAEGESESDMYAHDYCMNNALLIACTSSLRYSQRPQEIRIDRLFLGIVKAKFLDERDEKSLRIHKYMSMIARRSVSASQTTYPAECLDLLNSSIVLPPDRQNFTNAVANDTPDKIYKRNGSTTI
jgi:hypothetical protein